MKLEDEEFIRKFSSFWFCPHDGVKFIEYRPSGYRGVSGTPYFIVTRTNQALDIANAKNLKKIATQQVEFAMYLSNDMFASLSPEVKAITLVSVQCPNCSTKSIAPKLPRIIMDEQQLKKFKKTMKKHLMPPTTTLTSPQETPRRTSPLSFLWRLWYLYIILGFVVSIISVIIGQYLNSGGKLLP